MSKELREYTAAELKALNDWYRQHLTIECTCDHVTDMFCHDCRRLAEESEVEPCDCHK